MPWPVTALAVAVFAVWMFYPAARVHYQEHREKTRLEQELNGLKERNSRLRVQVDRLKTPEGVEELAREELGFVRPGEHAYVVPSDEEVSEEIVATSEEGSSEPTSSLGGRVLDFIFDVE